MDSICCVPGCSVNGALLHKFPDPKTEQERFNNWYNAIGDGDILSLDCEEIYKSRSVCRSHFEKKYLVGPERITGAAVPTLHLPEKKLLNEDSRCISCLCSYDQRRLHLYPIQNKALRLVFEENSLLVCYLCREQALQVDKFVTTVQNNQLYLAKAEIEVSGVAKANPKPVESGNSYKQNVRTQSKVPDSVAPRQPALNLNLESDDESGLKDYLNYQSESSNDHLENINNDNNVTTAFEVTTIKEEQDIYEDTELSGTQTVATVRQKTIARDKSEGSNSSTHEETKRIPNKRRQTGDEQSQSIDLDAGEAKKNKNTQANPVGFMHLLEVIQTAGEKEIFCESQNNMKAASDNNNPATLLQVQMPDDNSNASVQDPDLYEDYFNESYNNSLAEPLISEHEPSSSSTSHKLWPSNIRANFLDNNLVPLKELLMSSADGKAILNMHLKDGVLSSRSRRKITHLIITYLFPADGKAITSSVLMYYAQQIKMLFPKENTSTYFTPHASDNKLKIKRPAKGKLYDYMRNKQREYRVYGLISKKERFPTNLDTYKALRSNNTGCNEEDINFLKASSEPWELVVEKWSRSFAYRFETLNKTEMNYDDYMNLYPALKKPAGFNLLLQDFKQLYPDNYDKLNEQFPLQKEKLVEVIIKSHSRNPDLQEYILKYQEISGHKNAKEATSIIALMMLATILAPTAFKNKLVWRPSKTESREGFITQIENQTQLLETIYGRKEKMTKLGIPLQPFIIIVGPDVTDVQAYYIVINDTLYRVNSILRAVDVCFKCFFALQCSYPQECIALWMFIQKAFYNIETPRDTEFVSVNTLLSDFS